MKAVFIVYNQSVTEEVQEIFDDLSIRGYTHWKGIHGKGTVKGDPHEGTHTWPELNNAHLAVVEDQAVPDLLEKLQKLDKEVEDQGLRAFVWNVEQSI